MGIRENARRLKELQAENPGLSSKELIRLLEREQSEAKDTRYADHFARTAVQPYDEIVEERIWRRGGLDTFVKDYIRIVGLQPEDVFGIFVEPEEYRGALRFVYRDRPEYEDGRRRYRKVVLGE